MMGRALTERSGRPMMPATMGHKHLVIEASSVEAVDKTHFLNPNGRRRNRSLGDATGLTGLGVHHIEIPPGAESTELHRHLQEDEALYVLSGTGAVVLDDERYLIGPGVFVGLPKRGPAHLVENTGVEALVLLVIGQRLPHDVCEYPRVGQRLFRSEGEWRLVAEAAISDPKKL